MDRNLIDPIGVDGFAQPKVPISQNLYTSANNEYDGYNENNRFELS